MFRVVHWCRQLCTAWHRAVDTPPSCGTRRSAAVAAAVGCCGLPVPGPGQHLTPASMVWLARSQSEVQCPLLLASRCHSVQAAGAGALCHVWSVPLTTRHLGCWAVQRCPACWRQHPLHTPAGQPVTRARRLQSWLLVLLLALRPVLHLLVYHSYRCPRSCASQSSRSAPALYLRHGKLDFTASPHIT